MKDLDKLVEEILSLSIQDRIALFKLISKKKQ